MTAAYGYLDNGNQFRLKLDSLIDSRMLIQANSGGGKSYAVRKLLEMTHGAVQQIVIDPEGEFATLREKFDYVICAAQGGDALAHPKTAKLLAERLLETGVSAIIDIYELKQHERTSFVRIFLDAMVNAPKHLWHPCLVVLDEAHVYAPESDKSEAHGAVADIATRGRKRGFCLVAATQRISKLSKDVAAELNNKLIGRATLDVDVKRAAAELGIPVNEALKLLRSLDPGQFYGFGPATNVMAPALMKIGEVVTRHPKRGERATAAPKPTQAILDVLPKLSDLPKEAEQELRTIDDLKRELANARREITTLRNAPAMQVDPGAEERGFNRGLAYGQNLANNVRVALLRMTDANDTMISCIESITQQINGDDPGAKFVYEGARATTHAPSRAAPVIAKSVQKRIAAQAAPRTNGHDTSLSGAERKVLTVLAQHQDGCEIGKIALLAGYAVTGGGFRNTLGALRMKGFLEGENTGTMRITDAGMNAGPFDPLPTGDALRQHWLTHPSFGKAAREALAVLLEQPSGMTLEEIAQATEKEPTGGGFRNALGELRTAGVLVGKNTGVMTASEELLA